MPDDSFAAYLGEIIVLDTQGPLIYLGTLQQVTEAFFILAQADVHDRNDSRSSKDLYVVETRDLGVRVNRKRVMVMREQVSSISLLKEVVD